jgi:putative ABC transport system ATP-binding protein
VLNNYHSILELSGLSKVYNTGSPYSVKAVDIVEMNLKKGEIIMVNGPNGCGKTTLLSLAAGLMKPTSGSIKIMGSEITAMEQKEITTFRLKNIGFVFQTFRLLSALSVIENVLLILKLSGVRKPEAYKRAEKALEETQIIHRKNFSPDSLSGGEKQRVAIARALVNNPALILADEPTGSLDSKSGLMIIRLLCELSRLNNTSVIIVSHDKRIEDQADKVISMEDGKIIS